MNGGGGPDSSDAISGAGAAEARRRVPWWMVAVGGLAAVAIVVGIILVSTSSGPTATYDEATEQRFLASCTADGGDPVRPACQCLYSEIVASIPYERFVELSDQLLDAEAAGEAFVLPPEIEALVPACQIPA